LIKIQASSHYWRFIQHRHGKRKGVREGDNNAEAVKGKSGNKDKKTGDVERDR
jgi:hypothetical protein